MAILDRSDPPPITQRLWAQILRDQRIPETLTAPVRAELAAWTGREVRRAWRRFDQKAAAGVTGGALRACNDRLVRIEHIHEQLTVTSSS